jgi:ABC-2 type transport system permease protein
MKYVVIALAVAVVATLRLRRVRRGAPPRTDRPIVVREPRFFKGEVGLVMRREIRERTRSRFYVVGTIFILLVVGAAIVIPVVHHASSQRVRVGVVGSESSAWRAEVSGAARAAGSGVVFVQETSSSTAAKAVGAGRIDMAIIANREIIVGSSLSPTDTSASASVVRAVAVTLGDARAEALAHLTPAQVQSLRSASPLTIVALHHTRVRSVDVTSLIGVILIFMMLSQYNTWIMIGVMEEKSSRVIEVLLSAVRPMRLLSGKVLGIGTTALLQASIIVAFAIVLSKSIGSHLLVGTAPLVILSTLVWLILGYAFYCWVYAAAGSMAERQDQVQSLALPLSIPMIAGYIVSLTAASSENPSLLVKVFAYLPLTAPFAMPVLVGFGAVSWWQFALSALISLACTVVVARFAANIYRRAILRTGSRVKLRDIISRVRG